MKTLYFDCPMGAAGDMLCASLLGLIDDKDSFINVINSAGIPHVKASYTERTKCGICGIGYDVEIFGEHEDEHMHEHHHHHHATLVSIQEIINSLNLPEKVKADAIHIYTLLAKAEAKVHGCDMENIHFHEVGTLDAVCDIVSACMLMDIISPEKVIASPINVGGGTVKCAHGVLPVPAPATAELLKGIPMYKTGNIGELCTPTGAAILRYFADDFSTLPVISTDIIGYGMGNKDFETANCVIAYLSDESGVSDEVCELVCNLDDMTGEQLSFACDVLMDCGALDVYTQPIYMKKSRPAYKLCCLCRTGDIRKMAELIFKHTTTLGIRYSEYKRFTLERAFEKTQTQFGEISIKHSTGFGIEKSKPEFAEIAEIAKKNNISLGEVLE